MDLLKKHYVGLILFLTILIYSGVVKIVYPLGTVLATLLSDLVLILGISFIYWLNRRHDDYIEYVPISLLRQNKKDIIIGFILIIALWVSGQFVFLWVYKTFGDNTFTENYANVFNDPSVLIYTILLTSIVAPIMEELVFRYLLFGYFIAKKRSFLRYLFFHLLSASLFGMIHGTMVHQIIVLPLAVITAVLMYKTNRIIFPILGHILFNNLSIFMGSLLVFYQMGISNPIIVITMVIIYVIVVFTILIYAWTRYRN